jgi:hypothetical protein
VVEISCVEHPLLSHILTKSTLSKLFGVTTNAADVTSVPNYDYLLVHVYLQFTVAGFS